MKLGSYVKESHLTKCETYKGTYINRQGGGYIERDIGRERERERGRERKRERKGYTFLIDLKSPHTKPKYACSMMEPSKKA